MCERTLARTPSCWSLMLPHQLALALRSPPVFGYAISGSATGNWLGRAGALGNGARVCSAGGETAQARRRFRKTASEDGTVMSGPMEPVVAGAYFVGSSPLGRAGRTSDRDHERGVEVTDA